MFNISSGPNFVYLACTIQDASFIESDHNGESATTFPMIISVGDTNSTVVILLARSFSSAKTCMIENAMTVNCWQKQT